MEAVWLCKVKVFGCILPACASVFRELLSRDFVEPGGNCSLSFLRLQTVAVEGSGAAILGAPLVGYLAEHSFGYLRTTLLVAEMPEQLRLGNANALASALAFLTVIPWSISFLLYGLLHFTYGQSPDPQPAGQYLPQPPLLSLLQIRLRASHSLLAASRHCCCFSLHCCALQAVSACACLRVKDRLNTQTQSKHPDAVIHQGVSFTPHIRTAGAVRMWGGALCGHMVGRGSGCALGIFIK